MGTSWFRRPTSESWKFWRKPLRLRISIPPRSTSSTTPSRISIEYDEVQDDPYVRRLVMSDEIRRVITRDKSSGRFHRRIWDGQRWMVDERCQADQSGQFDVVDDFNPAIEDRNKMCRFCFKGML